jgi:16S rRNA (cytidine1402-2'-O)-methyltransferase
MLYVVSTPIGNLKDITLRAIEVLKAVDLIACEDTRHTKIILDRYAIKTPTTSYYQYNKIGKAKYLINLLKQDKGIALVSDSGTPGILDPGYHLINLALQNNITITSIPGPVALIAALVVSGKPTHRFIFEGFLPPRKQARKNRLEGLKKLKHTIVFYESPHRILSTLEDIKEIFGDIKLVCARELTKKFEEIKRGRVTSLISELSSRRVRGEFVVII